MTYELFRQKFESDYPDELLMPKFDPEECYPGSDIPLLFFASMRDPHLGLFSKEVAKEFFETNDFYYVRRHELYVRRSNLKNHCSSYYFYHPKNARYIPNKYDGQYLDPMEMSKEIVRCFTAPDREKMSDAIREYLARIDGEYKDWFRTYSGEERDIPALAISLVAFYLPQDKMGHLELALKYAFGYLARLYLGTGDVNSLYLIQLLSWARTSGKELVCKNEELFDKFRLYCIENSYDSVNKSFKFDYDPRLIFYKPKWSDSYLEKCQKENIVISESDKEDIDHLIESLCHY